MTEENDEHLTLNMNIVAEQLKKLAPDNFSELESLVKKQADVRKPPDFSSMNNYEFEQYSRKLVRDLGKR